MLPEPDRGARALAGVLRAFWSAFDAAEVNRRLDLWVVATARVASSNRVEMCRAPAALASASDQPSILEQGREDAVGEIAEFPIASWTAPRSSARIALAAPGPTSMSARHGSEVRLECDEVLLGAVVEVALDPPPLAVGGGDDPRPRRPQLVGPSAKLFERRLQLGVEPDVAEDEADLTRQLGECAIDVIVGLATPSCCSTTISPNSSPPCTTGATRTAIPHGRRASPATRSRWTSADDPRTRESRQLGLADAERRRPAVRIRHDPLECAVPERPDLRRLEPETPRAGSPRAATGAPRAGLHGRAVSRRHAPLRPASPARRGRAGLRAYRAAGVSGRTARRRSRPQPATGRATSAARALAAARGLRRRKRRPRRSASLGRRAKLPAGLAVRRWHRRFSDHREQECGGERNERCDDDVEKSRGPVEEDVEREPHDEDLHCSRRRARVSVGAAHSHASAALGTRPSVRQIERHVTPPATPRQRVSRPHSTPVPRRRRSRGAPPRARAAG